MQHGVIQISKNAPSFFVDISLGGRFNKGTLKKGREHIHNLLLPISLHFQKKPQPLEKGSLNWTYMISYQRLTSMKCVIWLK